MKGKMLSDMLLLATVRHHGQFDKGGNPYILHPLKVMHYLKTDDEELMCIALGHDLLEDTYASVELGAVDLTNRGFTPRIISGILALTKLPGESYEAYVTTLKKNPDAIKVKLADLRHNSDIRRLKGIRNKDIERLARYHALYIDLQRELLITVKEEDENEIVVHPTCLPGGG